MNATPAAQPVRIGMLTPSSNVRLEPVCHRMAEQLENVSVHFTRLRVKTLSLDETSRAQFTVDAMLRSASLLADANVDVIAWNGTSGSWLGLEHDIQICEAIRAETGKPATTSAISIIQAVRSFGASTCGLAVPYTRDVTEQIAAIYGEAGVRCVSAEMLGLEDNDDISRLEPADVDSLMRAAALDRPDCVAVVCTNVDAASRTSVLEAELGLPVIDSISATMWSALALAGRDSTVLSKTWGSLFELQPTGL